MPLDNKAPEPTEVVHRLQFRNWNVLGYADAIDSDGKTIMEIPSDWTCPNGWKYVKPDARYENVPDTLNVIRIVPIPAHCVSTNGSE